MTAASERAGAVVEQLLQTRFQPGDMVRYLGGPREAGVCLIPGTLGSVVTGPVARRLRPGGPRRPACQVLFGYRTVWIPVERLEAEWNS
jgi:hypothetical protein